jgi:hypothetical protein
MLHIRQVTAYRQLGLRNHRLAVHRAVQAPHDSVLHRRRVQCLRSALQRRHGLIGTATAQRPLLPMVTLVPC